MSRFLPRFLGGADGDQKRSATPEVDWHPAWLGYRLIADQLLWDAAQSTTLSVFLARYSFHDSDWTGLWQTPGQGLGKLANPPDALPGGTTYGRKWHLTEVRCLGAETSTP